MSEPVKIQKTIYNSKDFNNVVNTNFSQFINSKPAVATEESILGLKPRFSRESF